MLVQLMLELDGNRVGGATHPDTLDAEFPRRAAVRLLPDHGAASQGYMILNCSINAVAFFAIAGASALLGEDSTASSGMVILVLVLVAMASIGCIITYVCVHTGVIEYSQLESLRGQRVGPKTGGNGVEGNKPKTEEGQQHGNKLSMLTC
ncbi:hypothetical protein PF008_g28533 [Phytophthora fragariae]|uniref:Uncharacterized protein n=1 Tax=Phytophthora fragariae TaxID=53985 RepID=A0A6G0QBU4_9STRA|nr:hypothetical protein PF008_g28533 [Phytophthora fragariae]